MNPRGRKRTKKQRPVVPVTDTPLPYLQDREAVRFVTWHGQPFQSVEKGFETLVEAAELPSEVRPCRLRHTMATELRRGGVDHWAVQGFLGHRMPGVTESHAKFSPDYLSDVREATDAYFAEPGLESTERTDCVSPPCHPGLPADLDAPENLIYSTSWMVVRAVWSEPVSWLAFPDMWENTGN